MLPSAAMIGNGRRSVLLISLVIRCALSVRSKDE